MLPSGRSLHIRMQRKQMWKVHYSAVQGYGTCSVVQQRCIWKNAKLWDALPLQMQVRYAIRVGQPRRLCDVKYLQSRNDQNRYIITTHSYLTSLSGIIFPHTRLGTEAAHTILWKQQAASRTLSVTFHLRPNHSPAAGYAQFPKIRP